MYRYLVVILICAILAGCGKSTPPPEPTPPPQPAGAQPPTAAGPTLAPAFEVVPEETAGPAEPLSAFDRGLQEITGLLNDTDIPAAIRLCRTMQKEYTEPEQAKTLRETMRNLYEMRKTASELAYAIDSLASSDWKVARTARNSFSNAGEQGRIFLRHALRTKETAVAREAGLLLIAMNDTASLPIFFDKLRADPASPLGHTATKALATMAKDMDRDVVSTCFEMVRADTGFRATNVVDVLNAVFSQVCEGNEVSFNDAVGHPEGLLVLRKHVGAALLSGNGPTVKWGCERVHELLPLLSGFRACYYSDNALKNCVVDRMEPRVRVENLAFPMPDGRQDNISARWTGDINVQIAGEYSFTLAYIQGAPQSSRLWVDKDAALLNLTWPPSGTAKATLTKGRHSIRIEYIKNVGGNNNGGLTFDISGPKDARITISSRPWPELIAALAGAASDLGSTDYAVAHAAEDRLAGTEGAGMLFLLNAVKTDAGVGGGRAMDTLCRLVRRIEPSTFPELYQAAMTDGADPVNRYVSILCAALWRTCGNDPQKFGELVGTPEGYARLEANVKGALTSTDKAAIARACRNGYPFAPLMPGLRGRYFDDPGFSRLALERQDGQINVANRQFPLATNRQDNISADWTGWISIPRAGDYTFQIGAASYAEVYIDDNRVNHGNWWEPRKLTLEPGLHTFATRFVQNQPGGQSSISLTWEGPDIGRQVISGAFLCAPLDSRLAALDKAVTGLTSSKLPVTRAARQILAAAGAVGHLYLRNAVRLGPAPTAGAAAPLLAQARDGLAPPLLLARLKTEKDPALQTAFTDALRELAGAMDPKLFPEIYKAAMADGAAEMNPYVSILCSALWQACGNDPKRFAALVADPGGYEKLRAHVKSALVAGDGRTVARACRDGYPLAPLMPGLHGQYNIETQFDRPILDRQDMQVNVENRKFPLATNLQDNISVEWTGWVSIPKAGEYSFPAKAENGIGVYVDGTHVTQVYNMHGHGTVNKITLEPGLHPFRALFVQNQPKGNSLVSLEWQGPDIAQQVIPSQALRCAPWDGKLAELGKAVTGLTSRNADNVAAARRILAHAGEVGNVCLRHALMHAGPPTVAAAATLLAEQQDDDAPPLLLARLKTENDAKLITALEDALCELTSQIAPKSFPGLYKAALDPGAGTMNPYAAILCSAVLARGLDSAAFDKLTAQAGGYQALAKHVRGALTSPSKDTADRARRYGLCFEPRRPGIAYEYYQGAWPGGGTLPDFNTLTPVTNGVVSTISIAPRRSNDGFAFRYTGKIQIASEGTYSFYTASDDGSKLFINGALIVNNDGAHGTVEQSGTVKLTAGFHDIVVIFCQGGGGFDLTASWQGPGIAAKQEIPAAVLYHTPGPKSLKRP